MIFVLDLLGQGGWDRRMQMSQEWLNRFEKNQETGEENSLQGCKAKNGYDLTFQRRVLLASHSYPSALGKNSTGTGQQAHYKPALLLLNLWEQEHIILYPEIAARGKKKGVPAEVHINAAAGIVLKGSLNKTENRWGHSQSSFCRDDRIGRVLGLPTGSE